MSEPSLFAHVVQHKLATWRLDLPHLVRLCVERFAPPIGNTLNHYLTWHVVKVHQKAGEDSPC